MKHVLLFDLGGVIVPWVGIESLMERQGVSRETIVETFAQSETFNAYEAGLCDDLTFTTEMVKLFDMDMPPEAFAALWNSWVHPPFPNTLETLKTLRQNYTLACLSNTNALHWAHLHEMVQLEDVFDDCFASHIMGVAKPAQRSFQIPLEEMGVSASEVLYFDDTMLNVKAARKQGLETYHVDRHKGVLPILRFLKII
ncbi:HAD family hydrolase [Litorimonas haliclonae]|uniref:HAD family hydrolase n=1 Tax=Litorimonas haliclonae TaxID=2081977 RepID=UPI0039EEA033